MTDKPSLPNMTATEIANAKHPPLPGNALLKPLIDRETQLLGLVIPWKRLTPAECLALWGDPRRTRG